jgi:hypothetical protein
MQSIFFITLRQKDINIKINRYENTDLYKQRA